MAKHKAKRYGLAIIAALYLATWMWGVPLVHTYEASNIIIAYKKALSRNNKGYSVTQNHPRMKFGMSFVPLPFIVVSYHESQVARLAGYGGTTAYLVFFGKPIPFFELTNWVS